MSNALVGLLTLRLPSLGGAFSLSCGLVFFVCFYDLLIILVCFPRPRVGGFDVFIRALYSHQ